MNGCCPHLSPSWEALVAGQLRVLCSPSSPMGAHQPVGLGLRAIPGGCPQHWACSPPSSWRSARWACGCGEPSVGWSALPALLLRCPSSGCSEAALAASYCRSFHFLGCWGSPSGSRTPGKRPARGRDSCKSALCSILTLDLSVPFFRGKGQEDQEEDEAAPSQGGRKEAVGGRVLPLW